MMLGLTTERRWPSASPAGHSAREDGLRYTPHDDAPRPGARGVALASRHLRQMPPLLLRLFEASLPPILVVLARRVRLAQSKRQQPVHELLVGGEYLVEVAVIRPADTQVVRASRCLPDAGWDRQRDCRRCLP